MSDKQSQNSIQQHSHDDSGECLYCERHSELAAPSGSARFLVHRAKYPEYYTGHNEHGYPGWISNRAYGLKIHEHKLVEVMKSITGHGEISATLIAPNK